MVQGGDYGSFLHPAASESLEKNWGSFRLHRESLCFRPSGAISKRTGDPCRGLPQCSPTASLVDDHNQYSLGPLKSRTLIALTALNFPQVPHNGYNLDRLDLDSGSCTELLY